MSFPEDEPLSNYDFSRVLICGDWHGDIVGARMAIEAAVEAECEAILHVGDLCWRWNGVSPTVFDYPLEAALAGHGLPMIWVDGNHENHEIIRALDPRPDGFVECSPHLFWAPRAHRWSWSGKQFAALGGAFSIDFMHRTPQWDLFPELENVQAADVAYLGDKKVDFLITHEVAGGTPVRKQLVVPEVIEQASSVSRRRVREAVEYTHPEIVFSGHWHQFVDADIRRVSDGGRTRTIVLDMQRKRRNAVVLNVGSGDVEHLPPGWNRS